MRRKCKIFSRRLPSGMTLVEVIVGTALLGTLLVSILLARGRLSVQTRRAEVRIEACAVLDGLLETWWSDRDRLPRAGEGAVPGRPGWSWRTRTVDREGAEVLRAEVVAVEVFRPAPGGGASGEPPAASVEILMPGRSGGTDP